MQLNELGLLTSLSHLEKPNFLETKIFWRPENLNLLLLRASTTSAWGENVKNKSAIEQIH